MLGTSGAASRFEAQHTTRLTPLLGRADEIDLLSRRWRDATQGEGRVVVLTGEPGIGKSYCSCVSGAAASRATYQVAPLLLGASHQQRAVPFIGQLERAARFSASTRPRRSSPSSAVLVQSGVNPANSVPILASLLSLPPSERYPLPELSPQKRKEALAALTAQLEGLSAQQPVVVFEDAHWVDPPRWSCSRFRWSACRSFGCCCSSPRDRVRAALAGSCACDDAPLTRLNRRDGSAIIERIAAGKTLPGEVVNQILARTDGVPLFIEELTKTVLEGGLLQERDGDYVLDRPLPSLAIPTTLHASLMARLDRLAPVRGGGPDRRRGPSRVLLRTAERRGRAAGRNWRRRLPSWFSRSWCSAGANCRKRSTPSSTCWCGRRLLGLLKSRRMQLHAAIASAFEQRFRRSSKPSRKRWRII